MAEETQYTANTGLVKISTANTKRDGTGTLGTVLTAGSNGTLIKCVWIHSLVNTAQGMIRLFVAGAGTPSLIAEIEVPPVTKSATSPAFSKRVDLNFVLNAGYTLQAGTNNAENTAIIAEGMDWAYYSSSVREDTTELSPVNGFVRISTANSSLTGSGTLGSLLTATSSGFNGCSVESITIKATGATTDGMVRVFVVNIGATNAYLLAEIQVPSITPSATTPSFEHTIVFDDDLDLQSGCSLAVSTEKAETFVVTAVANNWKYKP